MPYHFAHGANRVLDKEQRRLGCILVLQCLSTFYTSNSFRLSTIAFRMISDYTGLSLDVTQKLLDFLSQHGYVALSTSDDSARLDPLTWEKESNQCSRKLYYAYFVSNAPSCMRNIYSLQPTYPNCPRVNLPEPDDDCCSVTIASNFNSVYNTYTNRDSCCAAPLPDPVEYIFESTECVNPSIRGMQNLWYLQSIFNKNTCILFRRQLLVLYGSGCAGLTGSEIVDKGSCICVLMNDEMLQCEESIDLLANIERECNIGDSWEVYPLLNGKDLLLDTTCKIAYVGNYRPGFGRTYEERGSTANGTRFVEVGHFIDDVYASC